MIFSTLLATALPIQTAEPKHERIPFFMRRDVPTKGVQWDPNPIWTTVQWKPDGDLLFIKASDAVRTVILSGQKDDPGHAWRDKLRRAYADWYGDHQYAPKLHFTTCLLTIVQTVDANFWASKECKRMVGNVNLGYSYLRYVPPSYEFCRRAYLFNVGDTDHHSYGRLAIRLLDRNPNDRSVTVAMVTEYYGRKPNQEFEGRLFAALGKLMDSKAKRPGDEMYLAMAYRFYGREHKKPASYDTACRILEKLLDDASLKAEWPRYRAMIDDYQREKKDPNFGKLPGAKYIGD